MMFSIIRASTASGLVRSPRSFTPAASAAWHCLSARRGNSEYRSVYEYTSANRKPYHGDASFLAGSTERTEAMRKIIADLEAEEMKRGGVYDADTKTPATIVSHKPGYFDKNNEIIVGMQTDEPLKRSIKPMGGLKIVKDACKAYGYKLDPETEEIFSKHRKTHNQAVFDVYTPEMRVARSNKLLTGLPDAYGRGRIIGDYARVPLFGTDELIRRKKADFAALDDKDFTDAEVLNLREEVMEQIRALQDLAEMAKMYGKDVTKPAKTALEAVQGLYFAYLGSVKEQDGAAMSIGRIDGFLDTYFERDLANGTLTESQAQEIIDDVVFKLRTVKHLRTPDYNALFSGDPTWVTIALGGLDKNGESMVTKTSFRFLNTLRNLGKAPEPNMTVLWSPKLPEGWKKFCIQSSIETSAIQYENDELMRPRFGDNYSIACCVSAMDTGKQMQYFGARINLPKLLLYSINRGIDEVTGAQVGPDLGGVKDPEAPLDYDEVMGLFAKYMDWGAGLYAKVLNAIHWSHDKYCYERLQMALHDTDVKRWMAFGTCGISTVADSLSAIKHAKVVPVRNEKGVAVDFKVEGEFPCYGNDNNEVDSIAADVVTRMSGNLSKQKTYRHSVPTLSLLTITSNVVYGKATGNTPDGRRQGQPLAPGASPSYGKETSGAIHSLNSVAKMDYSKCLDGISNTFAISPATLGKSTESRVDNGVGLLDGYMEKGGFHLNFNCFDKEMLLDARDHPEKYPNMTIRVSGYAVQFTKLTREQQDDVISRTVHIRN